MIKKDLVDYIAEKLDITKVSAEEILVTVEQGIMDLTVSSGKLTLAGFGTFSVNDKEERRYFNPRSKSYEMKPPCKKLKFKFGSVFKESV